VHAIEIKQYGGGLVVDEPGVSIVVPAYGSTDSLRILVDRVHHILAPLGPYEVVIVDDGSHDSTWQVITEITAVHPEVRGIRLGRNYGQHNALIAGVRAARFPITVTIDDDLQNPPEEIPRLVDVLRDENFDIVYGLPDRVKQSGLRRLASTMNRMALRSGLWNKAATDLSSFRAFRTRVRAAFDGELGTNVSLDALLTWGSDRFGSITVRHDPRVLGVSNYSFGKLVRFAIDVTTGYSAVPLQIASFFGNSNSGFRVCCTCFCCCASTAFW